MPENERTMIQRLIQDSIEKKFFKKKAILIYGARQVGKTTLIQQIIKDPSESVIFNGDDFDIRNLFIEPNAVKLGNLIGDKKFVIIDEAQRIENIGLSLKILVDNFPKKQIIASGSSAFELANQINEPLTGRKFEFSLFPISFKELVLHNSLLDERRMIENRLIYGSYPEVINEKGNEIETLRLLANSYLFKDLLYYDGIKRSSLLMKISQALALQIGSEVSTNEIAQLVGADRNTVEKYIDLLEQAYVIFRLNAYNRNVRNEIKKAKKIYFWDNGIRNAIVGNFQKIANRADIGALWENYLIAERQKKLSYENYYGQCYFWRTVQQQEIDYIEEIDGVLNTYEIKWNPSSKAKLPLTFTQAYPNHTFNVVNRDNYDEFLM